MVGGGGCAYQAPRENGSDHAPELAPQPVCGRVFGVWVIFPVGEYEWLGGWAGGCRVRGGWV